MNDLEKALEKLREGKYTCVLCKEEKIITSERTGIAPMLGFLEEGRELKGFSAADKIIGKAAAMLFVLAGVRTVYGEVMSRSGRDMLESHGIEASWGELTDTIFNRTQTGICPMEATVAGIEDPAAGEKALRKKLVEMYGRPEK